jgi:hypothetical protein
MFVLAFFGAAAGVAGVLLGATLALADGPCGKGFLVGGGGMRSGALVSTVETGTAGDGLGRDG